MALVVRQLAAVWMGACLVVVGCGSERRFSVDPSELPLGSAASAAVPSSTEALNSAASESVVAATSVETANSSSSGLSGDDPETVTGDRIGDPVDPTRGPMLDADGTLDLAEIPAWISVGRDGFVVGYAKKTDLYSMPDSDLESIGKPIPVYNNEGSQIGVLGADGFVPNGP